ncbi:MAG TPA: ATP-binding protein, partial [Kofleriaceae bacterium]|nr:ATP-binding protein [Kofleriaceae bacterium]
MSAVERRGPWTVPPRVEVRAFWGHVELDLRDAVLEADTTTVIDVRVHMGNVEVLVPPDFIVESEVESFAASVADRSLVPTSDGQTARAAGPRIKLVGKVRLGSCEVITLGRGERRDEAEWHQRQHHHREHHERRRRRFEHFHAERELWQRARRSADPDERWLPWWLMGRMRWRIFAALAIALGAGVVIGVRIEHRPWWWIALAGIVLSVLSGGISWRLTRPLIMVIRAARDIGDGKLDTRLDPQRHGGEVRLLANAINDMAAKIQQQLSDQRQLLAAVSHELRTPLGHMRVLIETARDRGDLAALHELEREVLLLDDLVGKLLASSRLEFGNLDRRPLDLGELVTDVVTHAGIAPESIEAIGDVRAAADPTLVRRAVANLIDNARVHGGGAIAVRIERRAGQIAVEVDDAGPGVPADRRADAFRAFVPSSGGGLGLGLALVSRIAVAHGGGAWISDRPGGGERVGFGVEASPI